jgi:hypothetical protein
MPTCRAHTRHGLSERNIPKYVRIQEKRNVYMLLVRKPEGKRPLGRSRFSG